MPNRCQAIIWIDDGLVYWSTYALLCPNELMDCTLTYIIIQRNVKRWLSTDIIDINITDLKTFKKICKILSLHFHSSKQLLIGKHLLLDMEWKAANLTHCGRVTHICVGELDQHWFRQWLVACQAPSHYLNQSCWFSIGRLGTNFSEIQIEINFSFMKMHLKVSSAKWRPYCPGGDELTGPDWDLFKFT